MDSLVLLFRLSREKTPFTQSLLIFIVNILQSNANCFNDKGGKCTFFSGYSGLNLLNNVIWKTDCLVCSSRCPGNSKFTHETTSVLQLIKLIVLHLPCFFMHCKSIAVSAATRSMEHHKGIQDDLNILEFLQYVQNLFSNFR